MKARVVKTGEIVEVYHELQYGQITNIYKEAVFVNGRMWNENELDFNCIMKANEMPEKIYLFDYNDAMVTPLEGDTVYVRRDAFIEKACEFINKANLYLYHCISEECDLVDTDKMIEDFKNYIKGE